MDRNGCICRLLPRPPGLPRCSGGSASISSLSRPAQALLTLRPAGSLNRPRRPLSRGSNPASHPARPLVSYQINRQLSGWNLPPLVRRAFGTHRTNIERILRPVTNLSSGWGVPFRATRIRLDRRGSLSDRPATRPPRQSVASVRGTPLQPYGAGSAVAEHPPPSRFPGRPRRDPRGLTARECCVQRRAAQFLLRSVASLLEAATATRDRSADGIAIVARVSIFAKKMFSLCSNAAAANPMACWEIS